MADSFATGAPVRVVEVLHGSAWAWWDEEVLADDGILVTLKRSGTPLTFPPHAVPHPWAHVETWQETSVLKLRREDDWYSVWKFFDADGAFLHWYVNFETPCVRAEGAIEVNDLQLDIVVPPDGDWRWKDVQDLAPTLASGRITHDELLAVLAEAAHVAELLDRGDRWWAPWDDWAPSDGTIGS